MRVDVRACHRERDGINFRDIGRNFKDYATVKSTTLISYVMGLDSRLLPGLFKLHCERYFFFFLGEF